MTQALQRQIHVACRDLGLDQDARRAVQLTVCGKASMREMTSEDLRAVVDHLKSRGWNSSAPRTSRRRALQGRYAKKLQALWIAAYNLGLTTHRDDASLLAFVERQTGLKDTRWLRDARQAASVIEALKSWMARDAGIIWGDNLGAYFLNDDAGKVAWAIWRKLHVETDLNDLKPFEDGVRCVLGRPSALRCVTSREWQEICSIWGQKLRRSAQRTA